MELQDSEECLLVEEGTRGQWDVHGTPVIGITRGKVIAKCEDYDTAKAVLDALNREGDVEKLEARMEKIEAAVPDLCTIRDLAVEFIKDWYYSQGIQVQPLPSVEERCEKLWEEIDNIVGLEWKT